MFASAETETAVDVSLKGVETCGLRCGNDGTAVAVELATVRCVREKTHLRATMALAVAVLVVAVDTARAKAMAVVSAAMVAAEVVAARKVAAAGATMAWRH